MNERRDFPTIAEAEALLPNAKKVADALGVPYEDAPLVAGFVSTTPPPPEAFDLGRKLARERGW